MRPSLFFPLFASLLCLVVDGVTPPLKSALKTDTNRNVDPKPHQRVRFDAKPVVVSPPRYPAEKLTKKETIAGLFKKTFKRCGAKLKRAKTTVDHGLEKLSAKEKQLHNFIVEKLVKGSLKIVGNAGVQTYMVMAVALEPILSDRLIYAVDRGLSYVVAGAIIIGKKVGRFAIDHVATVVGLGVGLLVSLAITAGLGYASWNPIIGGALGAAIGSVVGLSSEHILNAVIHGNVIPTSLHEAAVRMSTYALQATVAGTTGLAAGALSAGVGSVFAHATGEVIGEAVAEGVAHAVGHVAHDISIKPIQHHLNKKKEEHLERDRFRKSRQSK